MSFDSADRKILTALFRNSRQPLSVLAKESGLTREVVEYRIERLVKEGVITGFLAKLNQRCFCAGVAQLRAKLLRIDSERFEKLVAEVRKHPSVNWAAELCGSVDIVATIFFQDSEDLSKTVSELVAAMGDLVRAQDLSLYITEYKYDLLGLANTAATSLAEPVTFSNRRVVDIDDKDLTLLRVLVKDCRTKIVSLAKRVDLSEDGVRQRIRRLEKLGVITGYTLNIDAVKCGFEYYYVRFQVDSFTNELSAKLGYYVKTNPYITYCCRTVGSYNVVASIAARDHKHFMEILLDIRKHFGNLLSDYDFQLVAREIKGEYVPERFLQAM
jgi:Lrp/AsnC family transcriptional regulator for asnA, asnC and gidA